jgi:hypothetical protein
MRVHQFEKAEEDRLAAENNNLGQRIFKRIGSIHMPEGLGIPGLTSPTDDDDAHSAGSRGRSSQPSSGPGSKAPTPQNKPSGSSGASTGGAAGGSGFLRGMGGRKSMSSVPN